MADSALPSTSGAAKAVLDARRLTEREYGCVRCQTWHGESDGPIYQRHIGFQSKHGLRLRPKGGWDAEMPSYG